MNEFLLKNGKDYKEWSYEGLDFLIDHLEELCKFVDFDVKDVIDIIIKTDLSEEQKKSLNDKLKKISSSDTLSEEVKKEIKNWENNLNNLNMNKNNSN
ncbi:hypothetical protein [Clostridioides difficile]|uniref:hypothetical protein n=1 Tax=Clostridioides difficile TaxID=1496 RepID=UPI0020B146EC|nr:hypothetical protein [Clostridioides difficile]